jgi:hypothetical protein
MKNPAIELSELHVQNPIIERSWTDIEPSSGEFSFILNGESSSSPKQKTEADYEEKMDSSHTLSFYETVAFTVNYVMGTGFLTIPWAFFQAGTALSLGTISVMVVPAFLAILYVLETMARATVVFKDESLYAVSQTYQPLEEEQHMKQWKNFIGLQNSKSGGGSKSDSPDLIVGDKKIEITELCGLFLGRNGKICYTIVLSICKFSNLLILK